MPHQGNIIFVESSNTDPKPGSSYYNGEYLCIRETPNTLYCAKLDVGYGGHETRQFGKIGQSAYTVIDSRRDDAAVREWIRLCREHIRQQTSPGVKAQYMPYIYSALEANAAAAERLLNERNTVSVAIAPIDEFHVNVPKGTKSIQLHFA